MKGLTKVLVGSAAAILLAGILPSPMVSAGGDNACYKFSRAERAFRNKTNAARQDNGLGSLHLDPELSRAAKVHTKEMIADNTLYHTTDAQFRRRVTNWNVIGENVGVGGGVTSLHSAFMNSPDHRSNILYSTFRHVGIGVIKKDGQMWVSVQFEAQNNPGTTLSMPSC